MQLDARWHPDVPLSSASGREAVPSTTSEGPLVIVGMPRSGTGLLRAILDGHERVAIPDAETEFLPYRADRWHAFGDLADVDRFRRFQAACRDLQFFVYLQPSNGETDARAWHAACRDFSPAGVFEALVRTRFGAGKKNSGNGLAVAGE